MGYRAYQAINDCEFGLRNIWATVGSQGPQRVVPITPIIGQAICERPGAKQITQWSDGTTFTPAIKQFQATCIYFIGRHGFFLSMWRFKFHNTWPLFVPRH
ncbi:protein of unknown function [Pararobbsia alpina]